MISSRRPESFQRLPRARSQIGIVLTTLDTFSRRPNRLRGNDGIGIDVRSQQWRRDTRAAHERLQGCAVPIRANRGGASG